jgi:hypothetical protein
MKSFCHIFLFLLFFDPSHLFSESIKLEDIHLHLFNDTNSTDTVESVLVKPKTKIEFKDLNFGFRSEPIWLHISLKQDSNKESLVLIMDYPLLDYVDLYQLERGNQWNIQKSGDRISFLNRFLDFRKINFQIIPTDQTTRNLILKIQTTSSLQANFTIMNLSEFSNYSNRDNFGNGIFFGGLFLITSYNLFIYFFIRERKYLFYVLYLISYIFLQMGISGILFQYILPDSTKLLNLSVILFVSLASLMALIFAESYLKLEKSFFLMKTRIFVKFGFVSIIFLNFIFGYQLLVKLEIFFILLDLIVLISLGVFALRNGLKEAYYYLIAWASLLFGILLYTLKTIGIVPSNFVTSYSIQIGSTLEAILLSIGLAYEIERLKRETIQANSNLKEKVLHRTKELQKEKDKAEQALEDLKESRAAYSKIERDSSVNQLAAHLAHEVNNPLNFISTGESILSDTIQDSEKFILSAIPEQEETKSFRNKIESYFADFRYGIEQTKHGLIRIKNTIAEIRAITKIDGLMIENFDFYPVMIENIQLTFEKNQVDLSKYKIQFQGKPWDQRIPEVIKVHSQRHILARAIRTLTNNALHFSHQNSNPSIQIDYEVMEASSLYTITFKNNGPSIPEDRESNIFDIKSKKIVGVELIGIGMVKELLKSVQGNIMLLDHGRESGWVAFQVYFKDFE